MQPTNHSHSDNEEKSTPSADQGQHGVDFARYRMNPVQGEESEEAARAVPRRIGVALVVLLVLAAAVAAILTWNKLTQEQSPSKSLDPEVRAQARQLTENIVKRIRSLQGYVYDVDYPTSTKLRIFINPTFLEESGVERPVTDEEIERATRRVVQEFRAYGAEHRALTVEAFVVEDPMAAVDRAPVAVGTYDPETESVRVGLTTHIPMPEGTGTGDAPPGEGHIGARGGTGMAPGHSH